MSKSKLTLFPITLIPSACSMQGPDSMITSSQADSFTKMLREFDYFNECNTTDEATGGEHDRFRFVVKSGMLLNNISDEISESIDDEDSSFKTEPRIGFIECIHKECRPTLNLAKDAAISLPSYYPTPLIEKIDFFVPLDAAQPVSVDKEAAPRTYNATFSNYGKVRERPFEFSKGLPIKGIYLFRA